ncbi:MAG: helix-turn-helix domain-containing protein [Sulfuriferula sp.]|nr:helix-turn-helix domain-containing protein [Sulfuriferula sp.]
MAALGRLIRAQRLAAGLRIDDAAALCGVSVAVFSRLENGGEGVSVGRVFKILDALGLSVLVIEKSKASQISISLPTSAPI